MRTLGCLCYATEPNPYNKFTPRAIPAIFMGYSSTQKGYRLYNLQSHLFFVSREVHFREHIFPFQQSSIISLIIQSTNQFPPYLFDSDSSNFLPENSSTISVSPSPVSIPSVTHPPIISPTSTTASPKRLSRVTRPPIWLSDYVHPPTHSRPSSSSHFINSVVHYSHLSSKYQAFLSKFSSVIEPQTYSEAILDDRWITAMQTEIDALVENKT